MAKNDGGPALPIPDVPGVREGSFGMTLRDYFAAKAMLGIVTGANTTPLRAEVLAKGADEDGCSMARFTALMAYELADAMLAAREE